jgi:aspartate/methionine/tyrosine aminotransferase
MTYFVKTTRKGFIVAEAKIGTKTVTINGVEKEFRTQGGKLGFIACEDPEDLGLTQGDQVPFVITDKNVLDREKKALANLYWATPL